VFLARLEYEVLAILNQILTTNSKEGSPKEKPTTIKPKDARLRPFLLKSISWDNKKPPFPNLFFETRALSLCSFLPVVN
jgi:hypothetical protein